MGVCVALGAAGAGGAWQERLPPQSGVGMQLDSEVGRLCSAAAKSFGHHPCPHTRLTAPAMLPPPPSPCAQMYGFGLVSCVVDNANSTVKAQLGGSTGWATVSLEQLLAEHQKRAAAKPGK